MLAWRCLPADVRIGPIGLLLGGPPEDYDTDDRQGTHDEEDDSNHVMLEEEGHNDSDPDQYPPYGQEKECICPESSSKIGLELIANPPAVHEG